MPAPISIDLVSDSDEEYRPSNSDTKVPSSQRFLRQHLARPSNPMPTSSTSSPETAMPPVAVNQDSIRRGAKSTNLPADTVGLHTQARTLSLPSPPPNTPKAIHAPGKEPEAVKPNAGDATTLPGASTNEASLASQPQTPPARLGKAAPTDGPISPAPTPDLRIAQSREMIKVHTPVKKPVSQTQPAPTKPTTTAITSPQYLNHPLPSKLANGPAKTTTQQTRPPKSPHLPHSQATQPTFIDLTGSPSPPPPPSSTTPRRKRKAPPTPSTPTQHPAQKRKKPMDPPTTSPHPPSPSPTPKPPGTRRWTSTHLASLASALQSSFDFPAFAAQHAKTAQEVFDVFSAVVQMPLLRYAEKGRGRLGEFREVVRGFRGEREGVGKEGEEGKKGKKE